MAGIVLPAIAAAIPAAAVAATDVRAITAIDIRVPVEIIVVVNGDVVIPAPTASVAPTSTPHGAHRDSHAKRDRHSGRVVARRWISDRGIRIRGCAIHHRWVIRRHVHDLWARLLNYDRLFALDDLRFHFLLFV